MGTSTNGGREGREKKGRSLLEPEKGARAPSSCTRPVPACGRTAAHEDPNTGINTQRGVVVGTWLGYFPRCRGPLPRFGGGGFHIVVASFFLFPRPRAPFPMRWRQRLGAQSRSVSVVPPPNLVPPSACSKLVAVPSTRPGPIGRRHVPGRRRGR